jgi:hypothetical protein
MLTQEQLNVINDVSTGMAILEGLDDAIIGYEVNTTKIVYHYDLIVEILIQSGLDESEAAEYIDKNILTLKISNDNGDDITPTIFAEYPIFTEDDDNEEDINVGETEN